MASSGPLPDPHPVGARRGQLPRAAASRATARRSLVTVRTFVFAAAVAAAACSPQPQQANEPPPPPAEPPAASASQVEAEVQRIADETSLWPGFDPKAIPLALYDGERTYLYRHPSPPDGFAPVEGVVSTVFACPGRFSAVTANSSVEIGEILTATLMMDGPRGRRSATDLAATALHEAFHVYQRARHPSWQANEGDLFLYPAEDRRLLALRRLETEALRRALANASGKAAAPPGARTGGTAGEASPAPASQLPEADAGLAACWARRALALRGERFTAIEPPFALYERKTELNEGLATYVELRAAGRSSPGLDAGGFKASEVRGRAYAVGAALALLLDRFRPDWREALEADGTRTLDGLLESVLGAGADVALERCEFTAAEANDAEKAADADIDALLAARVERRRLFDQRQGWRLVVKVADGEPLWPQQFDPLNIERIEGGILHKRMLRLGNVAGHLELIHAEGASPEALTEGVGPHPLFHGIQRVEVAGLAEPTIEEERGVVTVRAAGLEASFKAARWEQTGRLIRIVLGTGEPASGAPNK